ncbi:MAG: glycosyltransferase family 2 protein, partial [Candidatus Omnitrophota bacterium]
KIFFEKNRGKGAAVRAGIEQAIGEYVFIQDADLEVIPQELLKILKKANIEGAEVVYGSRFLDKNNNFTMLLSFGNKVITWVTNVLFFSNLTDVETPAKFFRRDILTNINISAKRFEFEVEVTAELLKKKYRIKEIAVSYKPRSREEGKKIRWIDALIAIITLLKCRIMR